MKRKPGAPSVNVAVLGFQSFGALPIVGPYDILRESCQLQRKVLGPDENRTTFNVELVSLTRKPLRFDGVATLHPHATIATVKSPDLILIPSSGPRVLELLDSLRGFVPWIQACAARGARVVAMCTGAFLLAETGLLDGRTATTHWNFADLFRKRYPKVNLRADRLIVDEGNIITSGAATSFIDLVLYLIELYCGREAAILTAKVMLIEMGRYTQLPYTIFSTRKMHDDTEILRAQQFIENNLTRDLTIGLLAKCARMSARNFTRRFHAAVGELPSLYVQKLRIEKAKRLLERTNDSIASIMGKVGYSDERSFRRLFRTLTKVSPHLYRRQYAAMIHAVS
jgi:transcriptional regulator GlxA family with amidase domain